MALLEGKLPARPSGSALVKWPLPRSLRLDAPAQVSSAGLSVRSIAQQEKGRAALHGAQAQPAAGGEIERFGHPTDIGDNAGNRPAGQGFLGDPEQVAHVARPHDDQMRRIEAEAGKPRTIGQAKKLRIGLQLQVENGHPPGVEERACLSQGKAETGSAIADTIGKHLLQQPARKLRKASLRGRKSPRPRLGQGWFALDIGNDIPQRGKALLLIGGLHGDHLREQRKNI
jgi:hypothetical protein